MLRWHYRYLVARLWIRVQETAMGGHREQRLVGREHQRNVRWMSRGTSDLAAYSLWDDDGLREKGRQQLRLVPSYHHQRSSYSKATTMTIDEQPPLQHLNSTYAIHFHPRYLAYELLLWRTIIRASRITAFSLFRCPPSCSWEVGPAARGAACKRPDAF